MKTNKTPEDLEEPEGVQRLNVFLLTLYENELKFKRPDDEVESITSAVKTIVKKLMTVIGNEDQAYEASKQYLVGSMAEGTSLTEPDEFDFLVVLKDFSNQSDIILKRLRQWMSTYQLQIYEHGKQFCLYDFSKTLCKVISSLPLQTLDVTSDYGKLSIQSTTVCRHGPASVIKLLWEPSSEASKPLDILIDITPCIELHRIDEVIQASDVALPAHYEALVRDDKYMLVPKADVFVSTYTTTEVKIVQALSTHHKMCYMILKYCLNDITSKNILNAHQSPFSSYFIKTFVLRHAAICKTITTSNTEMSNNLYTCLVDILRDLQRNAHEDEIDGIFGKINNLISVLSHFPKHIIDIHIENIIKIQDQIIKQGNTPSNTLEFRKTCQRDCTHVAVQERAEFLARCKEVCHLSHRCEIHSKYDI